MGAAKAAGGLAVWVGRRCRYCVSTGRSTAHLRGATSTVRPSNAWDQLCGAMAGDNPAEPSHRTISAHTKPHNLYFMHKAPSPQRAHRPLAALYLTRASSPPPPY